MPLLFYRTSSSLISNILTTFFALRFSNLSILLECCCWNFSYKWMVFVLVVGFVVLKYLGLIHCGIGLKLVWSFSLKNISRSVLLIHFSYNFLCSDSKVKYFYSFRKYLLIIMLGMVRCFCFSSLSHNLSHKDTSGLYSALQFI